MFFSKFLPKKNIILGVDIGTSNIKIVQISHKEKPILDTYGIVQSPYQITNKSDTIVIEQMARTLSTLMEKAEVSTKRCVYSLPNSAVFTSLIQVPKMSQKELNSAVEFEAKKYVPLSLSEIDLSWDIVSEQGNTLNILLGAVAKQINEFYRKIFNLAGLVPEAGDIEAMSLIRALIGNSQGNCVIIDIGAKITSLNIIENGILRLSRNLNIGGETISSKISESLKISFARAEQFKKDFGVSGTTFIPETIRPILAQIKNEALQLISLYRSQNDSINKIILVGGGANLPGLADYFSDLKIAVELGDPLKALNYNPAIEEILKRNSLSLSVGIGLALRA